MSDAGVTTEKRTPLSVIREGIALRRNGQRLPGSVGQLYNLYWYLWYIPKSLVILFITRPLAIKGLPRWAKLRERCVCFFWHWERRILPRLTRPDLDQALLQAVFRREEHNIAIFLQRGANPNQKLCRAMPLLPYMVARRHLPIVRLLLEAGANVDVRETAKGETSLHRSVKRNDLNMVTLLLQHGARTDKRDSLGIAPVFYAAREGHTEIFRLLIEHGADPTRRCPDGNTAEDYARKYHHAEIEELCKAYRERARLQLSAKTAPPAFLSFLSLELGTAFLGIACVLSMVNFTLNPGAWGHIVLSVIAGNFFVLQLGQILHERKQRRSASLPEKEEE